MIFLRTFNSSYHPPKVNPKFLYDFSELLHDFHGYEHVLILDDFNIHVCVTNHFSGTVLDSFNPVWVSDPTYCNGHTLDLELGSFRFPITYFGSVKAAFSDHSAVLFGFVLSSKISPIPVSVRKKLLISLHSPPLTTHSLIPQFELLCFQILINW